MSNKRELRGFKILERSKKKNLSITLLTQNGSRYLVLVNSYFFGIILKKRSYEFDNLDQAQGIFNKVAHKISVA